MMTYLLRVYLKPHMQLLLFEVEQQAGGQGYVVVVLQFMTSQWCGSGNDKWEKGEQHLPVCLCLLNELYGLATLVTSARA